MWKIQEMESLLSIYMTIHSQQSHMIDMLAIERVLLSERHDDKNRHGDRSGYHEEKPEEKPIKHLRYQSPLYIRISCVSRILLKRMQQLLVFN